MIVERDGEVVVAKSEVRHGVPISGDVAGLGGDGLQTRHGRTGISTHWRSMRIELKKELAVACAVFIEETLILGLAVSTWKSIF